MPQIPAMAGQPVPVVWPYGLPCPVHQDRDRPMTGQPGARGQIIRFMPWFRYVMAAFFTLQAIAVWWHPVP